MNYKIKTCPLCKIPLAVPCWTYCDEEECIKNRKTNKSKSFYEEVKIYNRLKRQKEREKRIEEERARNLAQRKRQKRLLDSYSRR